MKSKRFAVKGLIVLAAVIAVCMFCARTVQTITTPKIVRVTTTRGKFEQDIPLTAKVYFPETENFRVEEAAQMAVTVEAVYARPGQYVQAGDTLFTASVPEYESKREEITGEIEKKLAELLAEDSSNIKYATTTDQNEAYNALLKVQSAASDARYAAALAAALEGVTLAGDMTGWPAQAAGLSEQARAAVDAALAANETYDTEYKAYRKLATGSKKARSAHFEYVSKRDGYLREVEAQQVKLLKLDLAYAALTTVRAPREGYITAVDVKAGDSYDGKKAAYTMAAADAAPVLRADVTEVKKQIGEKTSVKVGGSGGGSEKTSVERAVTDADGKNYIDITLSDKIISMLGGLSRMMGQETSLTVTYKAAQSSTLVPAAAIRSEGEDSYYVYLVERTYGGALGASEMKLRKSEVTVLDLSEKVASVQEDLSYQELAAREDRAIQDGQTVMDYVN